jgi:uncharacterized protein YqjF (DUF2071 family)
MNTMHAHHIDRLAPTRRPDDVVKGYQKWRSLLFLHWAVPLDALRAVVPPPLELDLCDGVAYVGVVPLDSTSWKQMFARTCTTKAAPESISFRWRPVRD